jgi:hypothetical protein
LPPLAMLPVLLRGSAIYTIVASPRCRTVGKAASLPTSSSLFLPPVHWEMERCKGESG